MNIILLLGSLLGLSSVMMAAYIDHSLAIFVSKQSLNSLQIALRYHQLYAVVITIIGLFLHHYSENKKCMLWLTRSAYVFIIGVILFSFSIYLSVIFDFSSIKYFIPIGGLTIMLGWIFLIYSSTFNFKLINK